jgi:hypothetical protein
MAVKFSQFTTASQLSDISHLVGYKGTANVQIPPSLLAGTTYTLDVPTATTNINLAGSDSSNSALTLTGGTDITLTRNSASQITIASTASGDTYTLGATTDGSNVDLNLDAAAGSDTTVQLTAGTGMTITQSGGNNVTFASAAGVTMTKDQFTGNNSTTDFTLSVTPTATDNLNIFISGVYQNSLDASGGANYSLVGGTTLRFATAPPTTAANGIEVVITE